jgi:hypothetical protein
VMNCLTILLLLPAGIICTIILYNKFYIVHEKFPQLAAALFIALLKQCYLKSD